MADSTEASISNHPSSFISYLSNTDGVEANHGAHHQGQERKSHPGHLLKIGRHHVLPSQRVKAMSHHDNLFLAETVLSCGEWGTTRKRASGTLCVRKTCFAKEEGENTADDTTPRTLEAAEIYVAAYIPCLTL